MIRAADLRELARYADAGGAPRAWLERVVRELLEQQLCVDPRRIEAISLRRELRAADKQMRRAGVTAGRVRILSERFRVSRSRVYQILDNSVE